MVRKKKVPLTSEQELVKRLGRYKKPPTLKALRDRLHKVCGGEWGVECLVSELVKSGKLRVTDGVFYLPAKWEAFSELG
jgi:hypothetical protein